MKDDEPIPLYQKIIAVCYVLVVILLAFVFRDRLIADFVPLDESRIAPNIVATVVTVLIVTPFAYLFWPPIRGRIHSFVDKKIQPLHDRHDELRKSHDEIHRKLDLVLRTQPLKQAAPSKRTPKPPTAKETAPK